MPKLISLYIRQILIGFVLSAVFVGLLLMFNVANLTHLISHTSGGFVALLMLWVFNGIVFAGVQFGISIMRMQDTDDRPGGGRRDALAVLLAEPVPVPVRVSEDTGPQHRKIRR